LKEDFFSNEAIFRIDFWILFGGLIFLQAHFSARLRRAGELVSRLSQEVARAQADLEELIQHWEKLAA
jgi:hypothetical protein